MSESPYDSAADLRRRRSAGLRLPRLDCGCGLRHRDPLDCLAGQPLGPPIDYVDCGEFVWSYDKGCSLVVSVRRAA